MQPSSQSSSAIGPADLERVRAIRRRVRLESGRPDGRCGKVAEAIAAELGWTYRWGHLRLLDGGICWIHCWNQLPDGTIVDATADQFEERWLGISEAGVVVLSPGDPLYTHYRSAPPGHLFRTVKEGATRSAGTRLRLLARRAGPDGQFEPVEDELASGPDTRQGWTELGARAVQVHSGWQLPEWIGREAGERLREAEAAGQPLSSRELEFALDAADGRRRMASHGQWTSPEWREGRSGHERRDEDASSGSHH
jgi:hypothetical protein